MAIIQDYLNAGFALVPIPRGKKGPQFKGWNRQEAVITCDSHPALMVMGNVGLAHAYCQPSPTAVLDIDQLEPSKDWLSHRGIDLDELLDDPSAVQILSGRVGRAKLLYTMPSQVGPMVSTSTADGSGATILEFRCATRAGLTVQDVLPPSIHPDTGQPYRWGGRGRWRNIPVMPLNLIEAWKSALASNLSNRSLRLRANPTSKSVDDTPRQRARLADMLAHISADCSFETYRAMVWAILSLGWDDVDQIAESWSRTAPHRYEQDNFEGLVEDFDPTLSPSFGTIDFHARRGGWSV